MAYTIRLTDDETGALGFIADRYTYADVLWNALEQDDEDPEIYHLSEPDAWEFAEAVEEEDGFLPLMGGGLGDKVVTLLQQIT